MGKLIKRAGSEFWYMYYRDANGTLHRESTKKKLKKDAEKILKQKLNEVARYGVPGIYDSTTWDDLERIYLDDLKAKDRKSIDRIERNLGNLRKFFQKHRAVDIDTKLITEYRNNRKLVDNMANSTVDNELSSLQRMLRIAHSLNMIPRIPDIPKLGAHNIREGYYTHEQFESLRDNIAPHMKNLIVLLYNSGMRVNEALSLKWEHVNLDNNTITLKFGMTKSGQRKHIVFNKAIKRALLEQNERSQCEYVFTNSTWKEPIKDRFRPFYTACKRSGLVDDKGKNTHTFHDFRRTFCVNAVRAGLSEEVIMKMSGWATRSIFTRYFIVDDTDMMEGARKLDEFLKN